ncbi:MAG: VWA domain-containing protein [Gammaproteobacteria bacterium]
MPELRHRRVGMVGRTLAAALLTAALLLPAGDDREDRDDAILTVIAERGPAAAGAAQAIVAQATARGIRTQREEPGELDGVLDRVLRRLDRRQQNVLAIVAGRDWPERTTALVRQAHDVGISILWQPAGTAARPRIQAVEARERVMPGEAFLIDVRHHASGDVATEILIYADDVLIARRAAEPDGITRLTARLSQPGLVGLDVELLDRGGGEVLHRREDAAWVRVAGPPTLLVVATDGSPLADSLEAGGWPVTRIRPAALPAWGDRLRGFGAVILDNVSAAGIPATTWSPLVSAVRAGATGLLALGGPDAFGLGAYRRSALESLLPVISEPPETERPADVLFLVDVSGSMGRGDYDGLRAARDAVVETAGSLEPSDRVGLVTFEVEPRVRLAPDTRDDHAAALRAAFPDRASGGTRVLPAVASALDLLDAAGPAAAGDDRAERQRLIVLVTDGMLDADETAGLAAALGGGEREVELIAIVIGSPVGTTSGRSTLERMPRQDSVTMIVSRDLTRLPELMRGEVESRRPMVAEGPARPVPADDAPLPGLPADDWPALDAWLVTRPRPGATVALAAPSGEPLLAFGTEGAGRTAVLPGGLNHWAGDWLRWEHWPALAAMLVERVVTGVPGRATVGRAPDGRFLEIDGGEQGPPEQVVLTTPAGIVPVEPEPVAPGRYRIELPEDSEGIWQLTWQGADRTWRYPFRPAGAGTAAETTTSAEQLVEEGAIEPWDGRFEEAFDTPLPLRRWAALAALLVFLATLAAERLGRRDAGAV